MKSPEYIVHGTSSEKDAEAIKREGFDAQEGRATVSADLIYSFEWATKQDKRTGSKSESEVAEGEKGRMVIMRIPEDKNVDYATHTGIEIDDETKEISGYSSKYESGRKQLAIYNGSDVIEKRKKIEKTKQELKEINNELSIFLKDNNIDSEKIKTKDDLMGVMKSFEIDKKIEILKKVEDLDKRRIEKRNEAELDVQLPPEDILMSVVPTAELGEKLTELQQKIKGLEKIDLNKFTEEVSELIESNKENFLAVDLDVREVVGNLLSNTMEAEIINMVRNLSLDVKRAQGYEIYNRGKDEKNEKIVDKPELKKKLEGIMLVVESDDFDIGMENLNQYLKINIKKLLKELEQDVKS
jgi:hypothetical protein